VLILPSYFDQMTKAVFTLISGVLFFSVGFSQPVITANPVSATNCVDSCVMLDVSAIGNDLLYQWQQDTGTGFFNIGPSEVGNDTLYVCSEGLAAPSSADFRCKVTDQNGDSAISSAATVTLDSCLIPVADFYWDWSPTEICFTSTSSNAETLFWLFGDGATNSANLTEVCHSYATDQIYFIKLIAYNAYGQDEIEKPINLLSINELTSETNVFPNPASTFINVQSYKTIEFVKIINMQGVLVNASQINASSAELSLEDLSKGVYTALISIDGKVMQHRLVKQ